MERFPDLALTGGVTLFPLNTTLERMAHIIWTSNVVQYTMISVRKRYINIRSGQNALEPIFVFFHHSHRIYIYFGKSISLGPFSYQSHLSQAHFLIFPTFLRLDNREFIGTLNRNW